MFASPVKMLGGERSVKGGKALSYQTRVQKLIMISRHAMLVDQKTEQVFVPLNDNLHSAGKLELANSKPR